MSDDDQYPPKFEPLLIRDFNGKIISGIVTEIDFRNKTFKVSNISILEQIGFKHGLEPIYGIKRKVGGFEVLSLETVSHWEKLPDNLRKEK